MDFVIIVVLVNFVINQVATHKDLARHILIYHLIQYTVLTKVKYHINSSSFDCEVKIAYKLYQK